MIIRIYYRPKFHPSKVELNEFVLDPVQMPNQIEFMTFDILTPRDKTLLKKMEIKERTIGDPNFWRWLKTWRKAEDRAENLEPSQSSYSRLASRYFRL